MFQEFWLVNGETPEEVRGARRILVNPFFSTGITVVLGIALGMTGYTKIWPLFGAANQLLAALGLIAVCAWLGEIGHNNRMFFIPMCFMMLVTIYSLVQTIIAKLSAGGDIWNYIQAVLAILLVLLAVVLALISLKALTGQGKDAKAILQRIETALPQTGKERPPVTGQPLRETGTLPGRLQRARKAQTEQRVRAPEKLLAAEETRAAGILPPAEGKRENGNTSSRRRKRRKRS